MIPLSFAQRRLWFLGQLEGPSAAYNLSASVRLVGPLRQAALRAALRDVLERHEVLRTVYRVSDGEPHQHIVEIGDVAFDVPVADLTEAGGRTALTDAVAAAVGHAFDLSTELPIRASLFAVATDEHVLVLTLH